MTKTATVAFAHKNIDWHKDLFGWAKRVKNFKGPLGDKYD